jgi:hypothetical protein
LYFFISWQMTCATSLPVVNPLVFFRYASFPRDVAP